MKRLIIIVIGLISVIGLRAEGVAQENVLHIGYGGQWMIDGYLSPLLYDGQQIEIGTEYWQRLSRKVDNWRQVGQLQLVGGRMYNTKKSNLVDNLDVSAGWGAHRYWLLETAGAGLYDKDGRKSIIQGHQWELMVGPYLDFDMMIKEMSREVNKPYSFDMGVDISAMAGVSLMWQGQKTAYRLRYLARLNMAGIEWLTDYWQSYYEVTEKVNLGGSIQPTWIGNRQKIDEELTLDIECKHSTWRIGVRHQYMHYGTKDMPFVRQSVCGVVGAVLKYKSERVKLAEW